MAIEILPNMIEAHVFRENEEGIEFLLLKRAEKEIFPGLWQMVTGKIEDGEKAYEAALREIKEETGFTPVQFWVVPNVNRFYSYEVDKIFLLPVFAAKVKGNIEAVICEEHCECNWFSPEEAKKLLAWPGQRNSVDIILKYLTEDRRFLDFVEIKI